MKKIAIILLLCAMLSGCAAVPTFETLGDIMHEQAGANTPAQICLTLPEDAESVGDAYFCNGFYVELKTVDAGDMNKTVQAMSGFSADDLTVMTASVNGIDRYEWVWSAASAEGEVVCRAAVLDDGNYHYCLTAVAPAQQGGALTDAWNALFSSFSIA